MAEVVATWSSKEVAAVVLDRFGGQIAGAAAFHGLVMRFKGLCYRMTSQAVLMNWAFGSPVAYCLTCGTKQKQVEKLTSVLKGD